jgi:hypothetical protein
LVLPAHQGNRLTTIALLEQSLDYGSRQRNVHLLNRHPHRARYPLVARGRTSIPSRRRRIFLRYLVGVSRTRLTPSILLSGCRALLLAPVLSDRNGWVVLPEMKAAMVHRVDRDWGSGLEEDRAKGRYESEHRI